MKLIRWLAIVVVISLISITLSERRALDPVQNLSLTASAPVSSTLRDAARPVDDAFKGLTDRGDIVQENRDLKEQLEMLQQDLAQRQDAEQRVRELEEALGSKQARPEDQLLAANVIAEDASGLKRMIAIDRGSNDGLDEGMVVLSRGGSLVGTVARAYADFAWIRLITDPDSAVNAQVSPPPSPPQATPGSDVTIPPTSSPPPSGGVPTPSPAPAGGVPAPSQTPSPSPAPSAAADADAANATRGVAEGDLKQGLLLDLVPSDVALEVGSLVSTSGLGGNYPRALLLGSIDTVDRRPQSPFTIAIIRPTANLSALDTVLVLTSFQPARLSTQ